MRNGARDCVRVCMRVQAATLRLFVSARTKTGCPLARACSVPVGDVEGVRPTPRSMPLLLSGLVCLCRRKGVEHLSLPAENAQLQARWIKAAFGRSGAGWLSQARTTGRSSGKNSTSRKPKFTQEETNCPWVAPIAYAGYSCNTEHQNCVRLPSCVQFCLSPLAGHARQASTAGSQIHRSRSTDSTWRD